MRNLILLAVQGAGKGTLAQILSDKYGYANISMGEVMREARNDGSIRAKIISECQDKGQLVPFEITLELLKERIQKSDCNNGYILDGFPRDLTQAKAYDNLLKTLNKEIGVVFNLTVPNELIYERIMGRRICENCGKIYNIFIKDLRPLKETVCDECNGKLYQRSDDTLEAMKVRIDTYFKESVPLIDYYKEKGILYEIPSGNIEETVKRVEAILEDLGDKND